MARVSKCEYCDKSHNGEYGSGRFCCVGCARGFASSKDRELRNKKISKALKTKYENGELYVPCDNKGPMALHDKKMKRFVKSKNGDILDITYQELEDYRTHQSVCEICGRKYSTALCVDHDHSSRKFRGLLCSQCNRSLGWYEKNQKNVLRYLQERN